MGSWPWPFGVIGYVTIRLPAVDFLLMVHCDHASILHSCGDMEPQMSNGRTLARKHRWMLRWFYILYNAMHCIGQTTSNTSGKICGMPPHAPNWPYCLWSSQRCVELSLLFAAACPSVDSSMNYSGRLSGSSEDRPEFDRCSYRLWWLASCAPFSTSTIHNTTNINVLRATCNAGFTTM